MKKIPEIINRLWNVCGQMEAGALLTCGSGIKTVIKNTMAVCSPDNFRYKVTRVGGVCTSNKICTSNKHRKPVTGSPRKHRNREVRSWSMRCEFGHIAHSEITRLARPARGRRSFAAVISPSTPSWVRFNDKWTFKRILHNCECFYQNYVIAINE